MHGDQPSSPWLVVKAQQHVGRPCVGVRVRGCVGEHVHTCIQPSHSSGTSGGHASGKIQQGWKVARQEEAYLESMRT